ncbi:hypothetical protein NDU88_007047 [Pleurodeles waltl]|uniref:Uncharacterized protein n=1 Tax=Pleurodeles waltl TaxID=8319 RepID=A0AAV7RSY4_PLEWA|nr:hypothetical protein NDU88_007047 [Pleurodeles waltl]
MLQGRPMGDPLSQLSLLFQVQYPVCAPQPAQTEPRPEGFAPERQLARARCLIISRSHRCAAFPHPHSHPAPLSMGAGGSSNAAGLPQGCRCIFPAPAVLLASLLRGRSSAEPELGGSRHVGSSRSPERHAVFSPNDVHRSPAFSGGFPLTGTYLATRFWSLDMLLFRLGPVHGSGASR